MGSIFYAAGRVATDFHRGVACASGHWGGLRVAEAAGVLCVEEA
jgi:hypothetical protein